MAEQKGEPSPILTFGLAGLSDLMKLRHFWTDLYAGQQLQGMSLPVPPDAFDKWCTAFNLTLGRFSVIALGHAGSELAGFVAARTRALPAYFGGGNAGFISEVFVTAPFRRRGLARGMLNAVANWFRSQGIWRLELQVVTGNPEARAIYERFGWRAELTQMILLGEQK